MTSHLARLVVVFALLSVTAAAYTPQPYNTSCANSTHVQLQGQAVTYLNECWFGCAGGECVDATGLALTGLTVFSLFICVALIFIFLGARAEEENALVRNLFFFFAVLVLAFGTAAVLGIYGDAGAARDIVAASAHGISDSMFWLGIFLTLMFVVVIVLSALKRGREGGEE